MPAPYAVRRQRYRVRLQAGLALSLALVLAAFSVPTPEREAPPVIVDPVVPDTLLSIQTDQRPPPPPPPPVPPPPVETVDDADIAESVVPPMTLDLTHRIEPGPPPAPRLDSPPPVPDLDGDEPPALPDAPVEDGDLPFLPLEDQPALIGGIEGLQSRVEYPEAARVVSAQGTVFVQFIVDETGRVVDPVALRSPHPALSEAALKAVSESQFEPGRQRGRPVRARYTLPVRFLLR